MSKLLKDSLLVASTKVISLALGLISSIFFIRLLGAEGKGDLALIEVAAGVFFLLTTLNANISIIHFVAKENTDVKKLLGLTFFLILISICITAVIFSILFFTNNLSRLLPESNLKVYGSITLILLLVNEFKELLSAFLRGSKSFVDLYKSSLLYAVFRLCLFAGLYCLYYFYEARFSTSFLIGMHLLTILVMTFSILRFFRIKFPIKPDFGFSYTDIKPFILFSFIGYIAGLLNFLSLSIDVWIVESYLGIKQLGHYALALGLCAMVSQIPTSLRTVMLPYLSSSESKTDQYYKIKFFSRVTFSFSLAIAIVLTFTSHIVVPFLYGNDFAPAASPLRILVFAMVVFAFKAIFVTLNISNDTQQYNLISHCIGIVALVILGFTLIPKFGIEGASFAVLISYIISTAYIFIVALTKNKLPWANYFFITKKEIVPVFKIFKNFVSRNG